jgi:hypothetical protein
LREEQEEMIRYLNQQLADQGRQLEENDRQWQMRLQQKDEEVHRRLKQMEGKLHGAEPDSEAFPSLLSMLNDRKVRDIRSAEYTLLIEEPVARIFHHVCRKCYHRRPYVQVII